MVVPYCRFTKLIICHLGRIRNIHQRSASPFHLAEEDLRLGNLKFVSKGEVDEVFGIPIPNKLISNNIKNSPYSNAYLEMVAKHDRKVVAEQGGKKKSATAKQPKPKPANEKSSKPTPVPKPKATKETPAKPSPVKPSKMGEGDEFDVERAIQMSLESFQAQSQAHVGGVAFREPISEAARPLPVAEGKGKAIATDEQAAQSLLALHMPKRRSTTDQFFVDAETGADTDKTNSGGDTEILQFDEEQGKDVDNQVNLKEKTNELDQGQAGSDPANEHVILEEPLSSSRTLFSMKNLDDAYTIRDQFLNDKSTKDELGKLNVESEVVFMVTVPIHQASSSVPPLSTPIINLSPPKPMFESGSYKSILEHVALYEALEASMERENRDEFLAEKDKSRKRRRDDQDPPLPPLDLDPSKMRRYDSGASGSTQPPAPQSSAWKISDTQETPSSSSRQQSISHSEQPTEDVPITDNMKPVPEEDRPATPKPDWTIPPNELSEPKNNWANVLASSYQDPEEYKLLRHTGDMSSFINWFCKRIGKKKHSKKTDLEGPAFKVVRLFHDNIISLQFKMEECHRMLTDQVDLVNPEGHRIMLDVRKPLPLGGPPGQFHPFELRVNVNMTSVLLTVSLTGGSSAVSLIVHKGSDNSLGGMTQSGSGVTSLSSSLTGFILSGLVFNLGRCVMSVSSESKTFTLSVIGTSSIVDLVNPEGHRIVPDIRKPLPLRDPPGQSEREYDISAAYGISHWWFKRKEFYITRHDAPSDRSKVRSYMRILNVISLKTYVRYGYAFLKEIVLRRADYQEYKISEADIKTLHLNDFKDLHLLHLQGQLNHLSGDDKVHLFNAVNMWIRNIVIRKRVEDLQLGIESYQTKINLTQPDWDASDFLFKENYTIVSKPRAIIYRDKNDQKKMMREIEKLMRETEVHKFSDGTLNRNHMVKVFRLFKYNLDMTTRIWSEDDRRRSKEFMEVIEHRLKIRRIFESLESFVGGRIRDVDYRLIQRTK
nr:histone deacetylase 14 [Tanacetum cinerariifolium]